MLIYGFQLLFYGSWLYLYCTFLVFMTTQRAFQYSFAVHPYIHIVHLSYIIPTQLSGVICFIRVERETRINLLSHSHPSIFTFDVVLFKFRPLIMLLWEWLLRPLTFSLFSLDMHCTYDTWKTQTQRSDSQTAPVSSSRFTQLLVLQ